MTPLKIEVTEAMREAFETSAESLGAEFEGTGLTPVVVTAALTAAFQHPEFVRQIREQVMGCVPDYGYSNTMTMDYYDGVQDGRGETSEETRASLGRLLGEG